MAGLFNVKKKPGAAPPGAPPPAKGMPPPAKGGPPSKKPMPAKAPADEGDEQQTAMPRKGPPERSESAEQPPKGKKPAGSMAGPGNENQALYDKVVKNGMRLIYSEESLPAIVQSMEADGSPVEGLMNTVGMVMGRLTESAEQKGMALPPEVVLHAAAELTQQLAKLSGESGGHAYSREELQQVGQAIIGVMQGGGGGEQPPGPPPGEPPAGAPPGAPPGPPGAPPQRRGLMG